MLNRWRLVYLIEVESILQSSKDEKPSGIANLKKYIGTDLDFIGLSVPLQRKIYKAGYSFSYLPIDEQFEIWNYIWHNSNLYDALNQALFFVSKYIDTLNHTKVWTITSAWANRLDNWAHSDSLSRIYANLLEHNRAVIFPVLQSWNSHQNAWLRRQSLVSLIEYSRKRKENLPYKEILSLIKNLLKDENYFVQKGLGWTLRETYNIYPDIAFEFLVNNCEHISSVAFSAAIEKLNTENKEKLKQLRKKLR
jgi:3-methyladenine DNA glycosylase AlkD